MPEGFKIDIEEISLISKKAMNIIEALLYENRIFQN